MGEVEDKTTYDGLAKPVEVIEATPLVLIAAGALLVGVATVAVLTGRAWRSLNSFVLVLEDGYERSYPDGYWRD